MFSGDEVSITIEAEHSLVGVFIDKFGKDIVIHQKENTFQTTVNVAVSNAFIFWVLQFGTKVRVVEPHGVIMEIASKIDLLKAHYSAESYKLK